MTVFWHPFTSARPCRRCSLVLFHLSGANLQSRRAFSSLRSSNATYARLVRRARGGRAHSRAMAGKSGSFAGTTYEQILASRGQPLVLYEAPSQRNLIFASYSSAVFLAGFAAAVTTQLEAGRHGRPVPKWIAWTEFASALGLVVMAGWLVSHPQKVIRRMTAIPVGSTALSLRLDIQKTLPFIQPKPIEVPARDVHLERGIRIANRPLRFRPEGAKLYNARERKGAAWMPRIFYRPVAVVRRNWFPEHFVWVDVRGHTKYKIDVMGQFDKDGQSIDQLLRYG